MAERANIENQVFHPTPQNHTDPNRVECPKCGKQVVKRGSKDVLTEHIQDIHCYFTKICLI